MKWTCKPGSVEDDHSSRRTITHTLKRPTRIQYGSTSGFLFGLASGGVYHAVNCYQTRGALLPHPFTLTSRMRRSTLCCTFRRLSPPRRYLAPCPMKPGLSSLLQSRRPPQQRPSSPLQERIVAKIWINCLCFFDQLVFDTFAKAPHVFQHGQDL